MQKLSQKKVAQVLRDAENAIRAVTAERDEALAKMSAMELRSECEKTATVMHSKGIHTDVKFNDLVEGLEKSAAQGRLPIIQEALDMMGNQMSFGHINNDSHIASGGDNDLTRFIMGDVG